MRNMKQTRIGAMLVVMSLMTILLTGCMYPKELRKENQGNPEEFITVVQGAIDKFREKTGGMLPIKNSTMDTPLYEKYKVDFKKLQQYGLLTTIPGNAFESGGNFYYVLVNAETDPTIKLLDIASYQSVNQLQEKVNEYIRLNKGSIPSGEQISEGFYHVDFEKLKTDKPKLSSVYNRQNQLSYMIQDSGKVTINYAFDLMKLIDAKGVAQALSADEDLRDLLALHTPFVPIQSVPYHWINEHPVPVLE